MTTMMSGTEDLYGTLSALLQGFGHHRRNRYQPAAARTREESGDESLDRVCWSSALFQAINRDLGWAWAS